MKPDYFGNLVGLSILIVDDEADARELLVHLLETCGAEVFSAPDAAHARSIMVSHTPSLIISDIGMPDEDGYSLLESVRRLPDREKRRIPAIALTAFTRPADEARAFKAGFDMHIPKPVQPRMLTRAAARLAVIARG
jgi:CheY-like chemotaxis protein